MTYVIGLLFTLTLAVAVLTLRVCHLLTDRDVARARADRQEDRAEAWKTWGWRLYAELVFRDSDATLAGADDALRARHQERETAIQYAHPADEQQVRPLMLPAPRTGDTTAALDMRKEVAAR